MIINEANAIPGAINISQKGLNEAFHQLVYNVTSVKKHASPHEDWDLNDDGILEYYYGNYKVIDLHNQTKEDAKINLIYGIESLDSNIKALLVIKTDNAFFVNINYNYRIIINYYKLF